MAKSAPPCTPPDGYRTLPIRSFGEFEQTRANIRHLADHETNDQIKEHSANMGSAQSMTLSELQELIRTMYSQKDDARGVDGTFMWLMEEVGELAAALRDNDRENLAAEFADVLAWLATIANVVDIDLSKAVNDKYSQGCPGCQQMVCVCGEDIKP